jgi:glycosyltransferase involved in cell wall biosynthesis
VGSHIGASFLFRKNNMSAELCHVNLKRSFRGSERQTELLVRELARRGIAQRIVLRAGYPLARRLQGVPGLTRLEIGKPFSWHARRMGGAFLHAHDNKGAHFAHAAKMLAGCDYLITRRVSSRPSGSWMTRRMYRKARAVAVVAEAIGQVIRKEIPGQTTVCIPSAVAGLPADSDRVAALRQEFGGACVVGHVGALDDGTKGQHDLITAAHRLLAEDADWRFVLVGGGDDEAELRKAAGNGGAIHFAGQVENVGDYLAAFDLFAFPSIREGIGSTLLDAMDYGLPIVSSNVGGLPEVVKNGETGLLIPPRDPEALANALRRLRYDPELAGCFAKAGRARAHEYSVPLMVDRYLALYQKLGVKTEQFVAR